MTQKEKLINYAALIIVHIHCPECKSDWDEPHKDNCSYKKIGDLVIKEYNRYLDEDLK